MFRFDQKIVLECHVYGSKPAAKIRWLRGGQELDHPKPGARPTKGLTPDRHSLDTESYYITEREIGPNDRSHSSPLSQISYLSLIPQLSDDQQALTCSAFNEEMTQSGARAENSDSLVMDVQRKFSNTNIVYLSDNKTCSLTSYSFECIGTDMARLELKFGSMINQESIRLGSDIFMDCHVRANPPIDDLTWLHDGQPLQANVSNGVVMSNNTLVLQRIRLSQRGRYQCSATNLLGKSFSNNLDLKPKCKYIRV